MRRTGHSVSGDSVGLPLSRLSVADVVRQAQSSGLVAYTSHWLEWVDAGGAGAGDRSGVVGAHHAGVDRECSLSGNGCKRRTSGQRWREENGKIIAVLTAEHIADAVRRLAARSNGPATVILIGSYARGNADEQSDLDLLVVERELPDKAAEYLRLREAVGRLGVGVDLLLYSAEEFERRSQVPGTLPYWARKEGKVLHDAAA